VPSKKTPANKSAPPFENLHIAAIQRIVGKHKNNLRMPLKDVRYWLERAISDPGGTVESKYLARMRAQLERDLGLGLAEIVDLSKRWPV
jgi:hypothetical protein